MPRNNLNPRQDVSENIFSDRQNNLARKGLLTSAVFGGLLLASIFLINLEGAVISPATVIPVGENKVVQHQDGGVIDSLLVNNGDKVTAGQSLILLNNTAVKSEHNVLKYRRVELGSKLSRLRARLKPCLLYTSPSPRDATLSRMPSSA